MTDETLIAEAGRRLAAAAPDATVILFGSRARGEGRPDSDLDLLVALEPHRTLLDIVGLKQDLEDRLHCRVDIVTEAALSPYLREDVLRDAVAL